MTGEKSGILRFYGTWIPNHGNAPNRLRAAPGLRALRALGALGALGALRAAWLSDGNLRQGPPSVPGFIRRMNGALPPVKHHLYMGPRPIF